MQRQEDDNARSPLLRLLIVVTLATVIVAVWYLLDYYLRGSSEDITWYPPSAPCDLQRGACRANLGLHGELSLSLGDELKALTPLDIDVHLDGVDARRVTVEFIGRNMSMGLNRFVLDDLDNGHFRGLGQLGLCSVDAMPWRAQVLVETASGRKGSWFDFKLQRRTP